MNTQNFELTFDEIVSIRCIIMARIKDYNSLINEYEFQKKQLNGHSDSYYFDTKVLVEALKFYKSEKEKCLKLYKKFGG